MKFGIRKSSWKKSFKARTTGKAKRKLKKALIKHLLFSPLFLFSTFRAFSLDDKGNGVGIESFRQFEARNMDILHAERTVA